jgi:hypothetical protein
MGCVQCTVWEEELEQEQEQEKRQQGGSYGWNY